MPARMDDFPTADEFPAMTLLLDAYRERSQSAPEEADGWVSRVAEVEGLAEEDVSVTHGLVLAADLLETRVADPVSGLRYRPRAA